ncbi:MAG TPA: hypothetical protein VD973_18665 [Symbiobacteriaceae bacterium]|jgi:hypothetical protein|nr:hypothetical protein [Symbiobacteriaceae bacterium]
MMRKMAMTLITGVLVATVGVGAVLAADLSVPKKEPSVVQAQSTTGISGAVDEAKAALAEPSAVKYKILVVTDSLPEDRTAYLDRVLEQWGWPEPDELLLLLFTEGNYDIRFAMGADFTGQGVTVEEMLGFVRNTYLAELRKSDPSKALAAFVRTVNQRMMPEAGLTPEQVVAGFYHRHAGYFSISDSSLSGNQLADGIYRTSGYLAEELIKQVDSQVQQGVGFDPFLCAQNIPERFTVGKAQVGGDQASVVVGTHWEGGRVVRELSVSLAKRDGQWKITNILCGK